MDDDLEGLDAAGGGDVRAATEVREAAVAVERDGVAGFGEALDEVELHELGVGFVVGDNFVAGLFDVQEGFIARDDLGHLRLDGSEVGFGEGDLAVDVVEEAVVGGGAVAELGLGEEFEDGRGHDVRGGVADYLERGGVGLLEELERDVFGERRGEVDDAGFACGSVGGVHRLFAGFERGLVGVGSDGCERLDARDDDRCGEARRDAGGDIEGCGAGGDFADGAVRKLDLDRVAHHI
jgi:hypothetical protein